MVPRGGEGGGVTWQQSPKGWRGAIFPGRQDTGGGGRGELVPSSAIIMELHKTQLAIDSRPPKVAVTESAAAP